MSLFERIRDKIFRRDAEHARPGTPASKGSTATQSRSATSATTPRAPAARPAAPAVAVVDVEGVLEELAANEQQPLNWRTSIVDLMKLVDLDPTLANRKELAKELGYDGNTEDSATMNVWLHKQVMRKLAENGGKVPASLRD